MTASQRHLSCYQFFVSKIILNCLKRVNICIPQHDNLDKFASFSKREHLLRRKAASMCINNSEIAYSCLYVAYCMQMFGKSFLPL